MSVWRFPVHLAYSIGSREGTNTWHMRATGVEPADTDLNAMSTLIKNFYTALAGSFPTDYTWKFLGAVTEAGVVDPAAMGGLTPWTVTGTGVTAYAPAPAMAVVCWRSSRASRRGRGRTFLGPLSNGEFDGSGTLSGGLITKIQTGATALISGSTGFSNGAIGVYSQVDNVLRDYVSFSITDKAAVLTSRRG